MAKNASVQTVAIVFSFWRYAVENPSFSVCGINYWKATKVIK